MLIGNNAFHLTALTPAGTHVCSTPPFFRGEARASIRIKKENWREVRQTDAAPEDRIGMNRMKPAAIGRWKWAPTPFSGPRGRERGRVKSRQPLFGRSVALFLNDRWERVELLSSARRSSRHLDKDEDVGQAVRAQRWMAARTANCKKQSLTIEQNVPFPIIRGWRLNFCAMLPLFHEVEHPWYWLNRRVMDERLIKIHAETDEIRIFFGSRDSRLIF